MVKLCCTTEYPFESEQKYRDYFSMAPYPLHIFQKWATEAIVEGHHVLICCPTGSGKTYGGEFAIEFFNTPTQSTQSTTSRRKKIIYTTPIKSLSNQKFYDFTIKYPNKSVGLITGDIKCNPDADIIIMTTEILLNKLYQMNQPIVQDISSTTSFDMNIDDELACVVFDEVHYIGDKERGHVWENAIIMLPHHVQMVMLSATLASPQTFAQWIETQNPLKQVYLAVKDKRAVPLIHYNFITVNAGIFKSIKDKSVHEEIRAGINKPIVVQKASGEFIADNFNKIQKHLRLFNTHRVSVSRKQTLNSVATYLVQNEMLPALCYVFSRKTLQQCAKEITIPLLEFDSKIAYTMSRTCEQIIRKLPNYQEYMELPEYIELVHLLEKGIGIHHAGMLPIFKEMVEMLFSRGCIKMLFATETMCVGINMPVKTVIFTDIYKFDGNAHRLLHSHEYTQSAGRAGRLGLDSVGHVIHLNNLFRSTSNIEYKQMMNGSPLTIKSNFKFSYNLLINLISIGEVNYSKYAERGMIQKELFAEITQYRDSFSALATEEAHLQQRMSSYDTPVEVVKRYVELTENRPGSVNKNRKKIDKERAAILKGAPNIEDLSNICIKCSSVTMEMEKIQNIILVAEHMLKTNIDKIITILGSQCFIEPKISTTPIHAPNVSHNDCSEECDNATEYALTQNGYLASHFKEVHCLVFSKCLASNMLQVFEAHEIAGILSCFTNVSIPSDQKLTAPYLPNNPRVEQFILNLARMYQEQYDIEVDANIQTGIDYSLQYELVDYIMRWCLCETEVDCKRILQQITDDKSMFVGEFVKAILKINNIVAELMNAATRLDDLEFTSKLTQIPKLSLKFVATNQSLYI